jgi:predicted Zn-dependent protease
LVEKPEETQQIFMTTFGVANKLDLIVPFSKAHEAEADKLALFFMSIAGYNPKKASLFLNKIMQADEDPQNPIEFLINHPCDEERIKKMRAHLPEAMKYYKEYIIQAAKNSVKASSETPAPISAP